MRLDWTIPVAFAIASALAGCCPPFCVTKSCTGPVAGADTTPPRFLATLDTIDHGKQDMVADRTAWLSRANIGSYALFISAEDAGGVAKIETNGELVTYGPGGIVLSSRHNYDHIVSYQQAKACQRETIALGLDPLDVNEAQLYTVVAEDFAGNRATLADVQLRYQCPDRWSNCSGYCANFQTDVFNCGSCGFQCRAWYTCLGARCAVAPQTPCPSTGSGPIDGLLGVSAISLDGPSSIPEGGIGTYHVCFTITPPTRIVPPIASVWLVDEDWGSANDYISWAGVNIVTGQTVYRTDITLTCRNGNIQGTAGNPASSSYDPDSGESTAEIFAQVSGSGRTTPRLDVSCR